MTSASIQPPLISSKRHKSAVVIFLHSRMRSIQYIIITLCAIILFGTVLYFAIKDYRFQQKHKNREELQILPNSKEHLMKEEERIPAIKTEKEHIGPKEGIVDIIKEVEETASMPETSKAITYTEKEGEITISEGSILLKSALKDMVCTMGEVVPYSVSCCGTLPFSEDESDSRQGCILMDVYEPTGSDDYIYRLRLIIGKDLVIYKEVSGFPKPDSKCYPIKEKLDKEVCASINFVALDNFTDVTGYNTCTFMNFGYKSEETETKKDAVQLLGYAENVKCDIDKDTIIKKSLSSPFSVVLRLTVKPFNQNEIKTPESVGEKSDTAGTGIADEDKWLLQNHADDKSLPQIFTADETSEINQIPSISNTQLSDVINPIGLPISEFSSDEESNLSAPDEEIVPVPEMGLTSVFGKILDFIRNHILSIFVAQQSENI